MERNRWEITYQGFRRDILRSLTQMPWDSPWTHHVLGPSSNPGDLELVSPQDDEAKIALLMVAVDYMLDRCEETMQHTAVRFSAGSGALNPRRATQNHLL
jgi:hypothetical protein